MAWEAFGYQLIAESTLLLLEVGHHAVGWPKPQKEKRSDSKLQSLLENIKNKSVRERKFYKFLVTIKFIEENWLKSGWRDFVCFAISATRRWPHKEKKAVKGFTYSGYFMYNPWRPTLRRSLLKCSPALFTHSIICDQYHMFNEKL